MKMKKKLPNGVRKHIRKEKMKLRKSDFNGNEKASKIQDIYTKFKKKFIKAI